MTDDALLQQTAACLPTLMERPWPTVEEALRVCLDVTPQETPT